MSSPKTPQPSQNIQNTENTPRTRAPYNPGLEFYDGGFDPNLPSNSPEFARALLEYPRSQKEEADQS